MPSKVSRSSLTIRRIKPVVLVRWTPSRNRPSNLSRSSSDMNNWKSSSLPACGVAVISKKLCAVCDRRRPSLKRFVSPTSPAHDE